MARTEFGVVELDVVEVDVVEVDEVRLHQVLVVLATRRRVPGG